MRTKTRSAFTLIELLVVIAIIAILAAILFPVFAKAREKAEQTQCISNVKQTALGILMYTEDYDSKFPAAAAATVAPVLGWSRMINPYTKNYEILKCPVVDSDAGVHYAMNSTLDNAKRGRIPTPAGTIMLFDAPADARVDASTPPVATGGQWLLGVANMRFGHLGDETANPPDGMASVAFCDGHAKSQKIGEIKSRMSDQTQPEVGQLPWARK